MSTSIKLKIKICNKVTVKQNIINQNQKLMLSIRILLFLEKKNKTLKQKVFLKILYC